MAGAGTAVSVEAHTVCKQVASVINSYEQSEALFGAKTAAISRLFELARETNEDGASILNNYAIPNAVRFIRALPDLLPLS